MGREEDSFVLFFTALVIGAIIAAFAVVNLASISRKRIDAAAEACANGLENLYIDGDYTCRKTKDEKK